MYKSRRSNPLAQHFLHNRQLAKSLVRRSSIGKNDTVIEIGPGKGIITQELLLHTGCVIAIEIDPQLVSQLKSHVQHPNLILFEQDFLDFPLPQTPYHIFANPPFHLEGQIIRKLLGSTNSPEQCHLIVINNVGKRWVGHHRTTQFSALHYPWYQMKISHHFKRSDFTPIPNINSVMISIIKRPISLLSLSQKPTYSNFIRQAFGGGRRLYQNLKPFFCSPQLSRVCHQVNISSNSKPSDVKPNNWLEIYNFLQIHTQT